MANTTTSPNMNLPVPNVTVDPGPDYASNLVTCLNTIDQHNHANGNGVQITPSGLLINSDLTFGINNATLLRSVRFSSQSAVFSAAADIGCFYMVGVDAYYRDGNGNNIRVTQSGSIAGTSGSISNLNSPASAAYSSGTGTFVWQSAANTSANLDAASVIFRNQTANSYGVTVSAPTGLAANYNLNLLSALPSSQSFLAVDNSGNTSAGIAVSGGITSSNVATGGISLANLAAAVAAALVPTGAFMYYGGTTAPTGWLLCQGQAVSRTTYAALFTAIGTAYGVGDGSTTFNLPPAGVFFRSVSGSSGNDPDASGRAPINGGNSGNNVGSIQSWQIQSHNHGWTVDTSASGGLANGNYYSTSYGQMINSLTNANTASISVQSTGGNQTNPINVNANVIIKT